MSYSKNFYASLKSRYEEKTSCKQRKLARKVIRSSPRDTDVTISRRTKMTDNQKSPYLNVAEAGAYLRLKKRTLNNMRWMGTGPNFRKHGGRVFYHIDELKEWSLETRAKSTSNY